MVDLSPTLRAEYGALFSGCAVLADRAALAASTVRAIRSSEPRYRAVEARTGVPWYVVGVVHSLESGCDFSRHLHNGDPLGARTTHVPAGRPLAGSPPFTWEESAADALALGGLAARRDWTIAGTLYGLETYNGFGYRTKHGIRSPYLWASTTRAQPGKYGSDGHFDPSLVSQQIGAAALLLSLAPHGASATRPSSAAPLLFCAAALGALYFFGD